MTHPSRDRKGVPLTETQGTLALNLGVSVPAPDSPAVHTARAVPIVPASGHLDGWIHKFARHVAEIVGGSRTPTQMARWTDDDVHADLVRRYGRIVQVAGLEPGRPRIIPKVGRVLTCRISDEIVEATVILRYGDAVRPLAARFEWNGEHWICTHLEFGRD